MFLSIIALCSPTRTSGQYLQKMKIDDYGLRIFAKTLNSSYRMLLPFLIFGDHGRAFCLSVSGFRMSQRFRVDRARADFVIQWHQSLWFTPQFKAINQCRQKKFSQAEIENKRSRKVALKPVRQTLVWCRR